MSSANERVPAVSVQHEWGEARGRVIAQRYPLGWASSRRAATHFLGGEQLNRQHLYPMVESRHEVVGKIQKLKLEGSLLLGWSACPLFARSVGGWLQSSTKSRTLAAAGPCSGPSQMQRSSSNSTRRHRSTTFTDRRTTLLTLRSVGSRGLSFKVHPSSFRVIMGAHALVDTSNTSPLVLPPKGGTLSSFYRVASRPQKCPAYRSLWVDWRHTRHGSS